jgi:hypothetical protein
MKTYTLKSLSPEDLRNLVERIQYAVVAPKLLQSEGWNTFDVRLSDREVASVARVAGIVGMRQFSARNIQRLCAGIIAALYARLLVEEGLAEEVTSADGVCGVRLTDEGVAYAARVRSEDAA